jgi:hypothetical protein
MTAITTFTTLMLIASGPAAAQDDCLDWGEIAEDDGTNVSILAGDDAFEMKISDSDCDGADTSTCEWSLAMPGLDDLLSDCDGNEESSGSPVCYLPPEYLEDCQAATQQVRVTCTQLDGDGTTSGSINFSLHDHSPECTVNASVSGGGCISPTSSGQSAAWLLLPLLSLGGLARRRA